MNLPDLVSIDAPTLPLTAIVELDWYDGIETGLIAISNSRLGFLIRRLASKAERLLYIAWPVDTSYYDQISALGEACSDPAHRFFSDDHPIVEEELRPIMNSASDDCYLLEIDPIKNLLTSAYRVDRGWGDKPRL